MKQFEILEFKNVYIKYRNKFFLLLFTCIVFSFFIGHKQADALVSPLAYWKFDEGTSTSAFDSSGNNYTGTLVGSTLPSWTTGRFGGGLLFTGVGGQYVEVGSNIPLDSNNWTISLWYKPLNLPPFYYQRFFSYYGDGPTLWISGGTTEVYIVHTGVVDFNCQISYADDRDKWIMMTVTRSGSTLTCYKNAVQTVQYTDVDVIFTADTSVRIGNSTAYDEPLDGIIDEVRVYSTALTPSEVEAIYAGPADDDSVSFNVSPITQSAGLLWCSGPFAPGWNNNVAGGGCSVITSSKKNILPPEENKKCPLHSFTRTLRKGSEGEDVRQLQKLMNCLGFSIADSGPGSVGNETTLFSKKTYDSLVRFQEAHRTHILMPFNMNKGTGIFSKLSLKKVQSLSEIIISQ